MISLSQMQGIADQVHEFISPTPMLQWPLLCQRLGCEVWVKHENHNPTGSFKVRGGLVYLRHLMAREPQTTGVVAATRGNFGQSVAFAASQLGIASVVVVPEGNSPDKNRAMAALGAEVITAGADFDESVQLSKQIAADRGYHLMPSYHEDLMLGVGSYGLEMFGVVPDLVRVYVPIGLGSGITGVVAARNALGLSTEVIGVVSDAANGYQLSMEAGKVVGTNSANTMADGLAVRTPDPTALSIMLANVSRVISVSDDEVKHAIRILFDDTHNVAEGAGAAATAGLIQEAELNKGQKVAAVLTGGNINKSVFIDALNAP